MPAKLLDGAACAERVKTEVALGVGRLVEEYGEAARPRLILVLCGEDPVSRGLVNMKKRDCEAVGIAAEIVRLPESAGQKGLGELIATLNSDAGVTGILVQLPLPEGFDERSAVRMISPDKDADGFSAPVGAGLDEIAACTPAGIMRLLEDNGVEIDGKNAVVVGRSALVGKPTALQLIMRGATVTVCHRRTACLAEHTRRADILVVAAGCPGLITADMIKPGAVVVDVGINRGDDGVRGDVDFAAAVNVAGSITPVPGGVGPMTRAMLLYNTLRLAERRWG